MTSREVNKYRFFCNTEQTYKYVWDEVPPTSCPTSNIHSIDLASLSIIDNVAETATTVRGKFLGSNYDAGVTTDGRLMIDVPTSAFGLLKMQQETPDIQITFPYGISSLACTTSITGSGTVTSTNSLAKISSGAAINSSAKLLSNRFFKYAAGQGGNIMFTALFDAPATGNRRIIGVGTTNNGYFFGYNGAAFGIMRRSNGVDNWTPRTSWNVDKMDGTGPSQQVLDLSLGNVFRINFQWLGFGAINFFIEEASTGRFLPVHRISYANQNSSPTVHDPSFPMYIESANTTNTTNLSVQTACFAAMLEGKRSILSNPFSEDNTKSISSNTLITSVITIRNKTTFQGLTHYIPVFLTSINVCSTGQRTGIIYLIRGATLGGTPAYTDVNTANSVIEVDTTGTTVTGGIQYLCIPIEAGGSQSFDLNNLNIFLEPGQTITVGCRLATSGTNEVTASLTWVEDR